MDAIRRRLERELDEVVARLHRSGMSALEDSYGSVIGDNTPFSDEVDEIQAADYREMGFATRELLAERASRLRAAIDRLDEGEYGVCVECGEDIASARLRAVPEVETCVRCQGGLERLGHRARTSSDDWEMDEVEA